MFVIPILTVHGRYSIPTFHLQDSSDFSVRRSKDIHRSGRSHFNTRDEIKNGGREIVPQLLVRAISLGAHSQANFAESPPWTSAHQLEATFPRTPDGKTCQI